MNLKTINNDLKDICKAFKLGKLKGFETEKNVPIIGFDTAFFTIENDKKVYQYYFKNS